MSIEATVPRTMHPIPAGMLARDPEAVIATMSDDVVFLSPVAAKPFVGIDEVAPIIRILISKFEELEYPEEWVAGSTAIVRFRGRIGGEFVEGVELLRHDDDGKVCELRLHTRPLTGGFGVARAVGPPLAKPRGRLNVIGIWLLSRFGPAFAHVAENLADRLFRARG